MITSTERRNLVSWYMDCPQPRAIVGKSAAGLIIICVVAFGFAGTADDPDVDAGIEIADHLQARVDEAHHAFGSSAETQATGAANEPAAAAAPGAQPAVNAPPAASGR